MNDSCLSNEDLVNKSWTERDWEYFQKRFKILSEPKKIFILKPLERGPKKSCKFFKERLIKLCQPRYVLVKKSPHNYHYVPYAKFAKDKFECKCREPKKPKKIDIKFYKKLSKPKTINKKFSGENLCLIDPITKVSENAKKYVPSENILKLSKPIVRKAPPVPKVCSRYYIRPSALKHKANERIKYLALPRQEFVAQPDTSLEYIIPGRKKKSPSYKRLRKLARPKLTYDGPTKICVCGNIKKSYQNNSNVDMNEINKIVNNKVNIRKYYDILLVKDQKIEE